MIGAVGDLQPGLYGRLEYRGAGLADAAADAHDMLTLIEFFRFLKLVFFGALPDNFVEAEYGAGIQPVSVDPGKGQADILIPVIG